MQIINRERTVLTVLILLFLIGSGCTSTVPIPQSTQTPYEPLPSSAISISTPTITSTITPPFPTQTSEPTLTYEEQASTVMELLRTNGGCEFPCFWSIVPGVTTWEDAQRYLTHLGRPMYDYNSGASIVHEVEYQYRKDGIDFIVGFYQIGNEIESIRTAMGFTGNPTYSQLFSSKQVLTTYGAPSRVLISLGVEGEEDLSEEVGYSYWLLYDRRGFVAEYFDIAEKIGTKYQICPNQNRIFFYGIPQNNYLFAFQSPSSKRTLDDLLWRGSSYRPSIRSLEEVFDLSVEEFTNILANGDQTACLYTSRSLSP